MAVVAEEDGVNHGRKGSEGTGNGSTITSKGRRGVTGFLNLPLCKEPALRRENSSPLRRCFTFAAPKGGQSPLREGNYPCPTNLSTPEYERFVWQWRFHLLVGLRSPMRQTNFPAG